MGNNRQSVAMLRASGSRHYSKSQLEERAASEVKPPRVDRVDPPKYLPSPLANKFNEIAPVLVRMGILTSLDADCLARYLVAEGNYIKATNKLTAAINAGNSTEADRWSAMQDRFFKQCRSAGSDLGLTVSGRCKLVLPGGAVPAPPNEEEAGLFGDD